MKAADMLMWNSGVKDVFYLNETIPQATNNIIPTFIATEDYLWTKGGTCFSISSNKTLTYLGDYAGADELPYYQDGTYIYFLTTSGDIKSYTINANGTLTLHSTLTANILSFIGFEDKIASYDNTGGFLRLFKITNGVLSENDSTVGLGVPSGIANGYLITNDDLYMYSIDISNYTIIELGESPDVFFPSQLYTACDNSNFVFSFGILQSGSGIDYYITSWEVDGLAGFTEGSSYLATLESDIIYQHNGFLYWASYYDGISKYKIESNGDLTFVKTVVGSDVDGYMQANDYLLFSTGDWLDDGTRPLGSFRLLE